MGITIGWIVLSFLCAFAGQGKSIGYWGAFGICLITSPLIGLIIALVLPSKPVERLYTCKWCQYQIRTATPLISPYCPQCQRNAAGLTADEAKEKFNPQKANL